MSAMADLWEEPGGAAPPPYFVKKKRIAEIRKAGKESEKNGTHTPPPPLF